jgi:hypothetical protein
VKRRAFVAGIAAEVGGARSKVVATEPRSSHRPRRKSEKMQSEPCGTRTHDPLIKSQVLYHLS